MRADTAGRNECGERWSDGADLGGEIRRGWQTRRAAAGAPALLDCRNRQRIDAGTQPRARPLQSGPRPRVAQPPDLGR